MIQIDRSPIGSFYEYKRRVMLMRKVAARWLGIKRRKRKSNDKA